MTERCLSQDFEVHDRVFELWCDYYGNWWLVQEGHDASEEFDAQTVQEIANYVYEKRAGA